MTDLTAPPTDRLAEELGGLADHLLHASYAALFALAAERDLSLSQLRALCLLGGRDDIALHELVPLLGLSPQATGRAVDVLVRADLATRVEDTRDRRVKRIALAPEGRAALARVREERQGSLDSFVATLDDEERAGLARALEPLVTRPAVAEAILKAAGR